MGGIATSAGPTPDLDAMIEQLQSGSYIEARERNPFAGPMTLIEPGVASKAAAALAQQQSRIAALEAERDALFNALVPLRDQYGAIWPEEVLDSVNVAIVKSAINAAIAARSKL